MARLSRGRRPGTLRGNALWGNTLTEGSSCRTEKARIMPEHIRRTLAKRRKIAIPMPGEGGTPDVDGHKLVRAAVLVPLFEEGGNLHVLLTRRTEDVRDHKGQISFPGGRKDAVDQTMIDTALRECKEEIGVPEARVRILGELDDLVTVTDYLVSPYVGLIPHPFPFKISEREIAELIRLPLKDFLLPERLRIARRMQYRGRSHTTFFFDMGPHVVWGVTAEILLQLLETAYGYTAHRDSG